MIKTQLMWPNVRLIISHLKPYLNSCISTIIVTEYINGHILFFPLFLFLNLFLKSILQICFELILFLETWVLSSSYSCSWKSFCVFSFSLNWSWLCRIHNGFWHIELPYHLESISVSSWTWSLNFWSRSYVFRFETCPKLLCGICAYLSIANDFPIFGGIWAIQIWLMFCHSWNSASLDVEHS